MYKLTLEFETLSELSVMVKRLTGEEQEQILAPDKTPHRDRKKLTDFELDMIADWYRKGHTYKKIAKSLNRSTASIAVVLSKMFKNGLKRRNNVAINLSTTYENPKASN